MHEPAGVGVGDQAVAGLQHGRDGADALDVDVGIAADLELEAAVALGAIAGDLAGHRLGRLLRDGPVEHEVVAVAAAQQHADRQPGDLAEDVPAGDVDARLDVGMPLERGVHAAVELAPVRAGRRRAGAAPVRRSRRGRPRRRPAGRTAPADRPRRSRRCPSSVSTPTIVLSKTVTDLPPDHL